MSGLSYLEKLLDGAEVEWKVLGDVAKKFTLAVLLILKKQNIGREELFPG
ncbi:hypothetical protein ACQLT9_001711 [Salmonella enterica subsp. diarizonae]